jgi:hypothetical protein
MNWKMCKYARFRVLTVVDLNSMQKGFVMVSFDAVFWQLPPGTEDRQ